MTAILQWSIWEKAFAAARPAERPDHAAGQALLAVTFAHPESGTVLTLDGFWDGGADWRVRFAPTLPGTWEWVSLGRPRAGRAAGTLEVRAPSAEECAANPNLRGHLRVSPDGRRFAHADGTPSSSWPIPTGP